VERGLVLLWFGPETLIIYYGAVPFFRPMTGWYISRSPAATWCVPEEEEEEEEEQEDGREIVRKRGNFQGNERLIVKYTDLQPCAVQKRLNRSRCRSGYGLEWVQRSMC